MENTKRVIARDEEVIFTNWTDEECDGVWNKKVWKLAPKKSFFLSFYLAEKFAKDLVDREYNKEWKKSFEEVLKTSGGNSDRKNLEYQASQRMKFDRQALMDKCIETPKEEERVEVIRPKEAKQKEILLKRDVRGAEIEEKYGDVGAQINRKALNEAEKDEDFELEK